MELKHTKTAVLQRVSVLAMSVRLRRMWHKQLALWGSRDERLIMGRVGKDAPEQESFPLPYRIDNSGKALIRIIRDFYTCVPLVPRICP